MKQPENSDLIHIPEGYPFWYEPMMKNLYTLERLAKTNEGGGGGGGGAPIDPDIQVEINNIKQQHQRDVLRIDSSISKINKSIYGAGGLESQVASLDILTKSHTRKLEEQLQAMQGLSADNIALREEFVKAINGVNTTHRNDMIEIKKRLSALEGGIGGEGGNLGEIQKEIDAINESLTSMKTEIEEHKDEIKGIGISIESFQESLSEVQAEVSVLSTTLTKVEKTLGEHAEKIAEIGSAILSNAQSIDRLEEIVLMLQGSVHNSHHVVTTEQEMNAITQKNMGSICFVRSNSSLYVWDGKWTSVTPDHTLNKIVWKDILDAPESAPVEIDSAVSLKHIHGNKGALDSISFSSINRWDSKADKGSIPTKLSELENDIGAGGNYDDAIAEINKTIGLSEHLTTENKESLVEAINEINSKVQSVDRLEKMIEELKTKVAYLTE